MLNNERFECGSRDREAAVTLFSRAVAKGHFYPSINWVGGHGLSQRSLRSREGFLVTKASERSLAELEQDCRRIVSATGVHVCLRLVCFPTRLDLDPVPAGRQQHVSRATTPCFGFVESDRHANKTYSVSREPAVLSVRACQEF